MKRTLELAMVFTLAASVLGCGVPAVQSDANEEALLGEDFFDSTCGAPAIKHLKIGLAYGRTAIDSAAFAECVTTSMAQFNKAGRADINIGPYNRCSTDP